MLSISINIIVFILFIYKNSIFSDVFVRNFSPIVRPSAFGAKNFVTYRTPNHCTLSLSVSQLAYRFFISKGLF